MVHFGYIFCDSLMRRPFNKWHNYLPKLTTQPTFAEFSTVSAVFVRTSNIYEPVRFDTSCVPSAIDPIIVADVPALS